MWRMGKHRTSHKDQRQDSIKFDYYVFSYGKQSLDGLLFLQRAFFLSLFLRFPGLASAPLPDPLISSPPSPGPSRPPDQLFLKQLIFHFNFSSVFSIFATRLETWPSRRQILHPAKKY